jgi:murein DD-endopeptidase MepM/ murein hydrolase activator NlpD
VKFRYATLMYLSGSSDQPRSFRVPVLLFWLIGIIVLITFLGTISTFFIYGKLIESNVNANTLLEENSALLEENRKIQHLEQNLKSNSLLLNRVLGLIGVSGNQTETISPSHPDSAIAAFMENSEYLLNLSKPLTIKDIKILVPSGMPTSGRIARGFNPDDANISKRHFGIDITTKEGTKMYATADGIVIFSGWDDMFGKYIIIDHAGDDVTEGFKTYYGHNLVNLVSEGEIVKKGDLLALSGSTGRSTGPHIHYEIKRNDVPVDPAEYMKNINYSIGR